MAGGRPKAPGVIEPVGELGAPPVVPSNPNSRLGRKRSPIRQGRVEDGRHRRRDRRLEGSAGRRTCVPSGEAFAVARNARRSRGARATARARWRPALVALEATGGFETVAAAALAAAGLPVVVVNPAQVRAFAKAIGQRAKTDPIDAAVIAHFAAGDQARARGRCRTRPRGCWPISSPAAARSSR